MGRAGGRQVNLSAEEERAVAAITDSVLAALRMRVAMRSRTYAPRWAMTDHREISMAVYALRDNVETYCDRWFDAALRADPHWTGTARFVELDDEPGFGAIARTVSADGVSCRSRVFYHHHRRAVMLTVDWSIVPTYAPGSRKRRDRYRRGRESVRPRMRRTRR